MVRGIKVWVLAVAVLPLAALLTGSVSPAVAAAGTTVTSATLFSETPGLLGVFPQSSLFMDQANGWTFGYYNNNKNTNGSFNAYATNASSTASYGFLLATSSFVAAQHGARKVHIDLDLNGIGCDATGLVKDFAAAAGDVTRLDVVFLAPCGGSFERGYISGEIQYNEPVTGTVRSMPGGFLFPPTNARSSTRRSYPVKLYGTTSRGTRISALALTGKDKKRFRVTHDGCTGVTVTQTSPCVARVGYLPGGPDDLASLVATSAKGAVISRTSLDGALLPGHSYWGINDQSDKLGYGHPTVYRPGPGSDVYIQGQVTAPVDFTFALDNRIGQSITINAPRALHVGDYKIVTLYKKGQAGSIAAVSYYFNSMGEPITSGTFDIRQIDLTRTDRGLQTVPAIAMNLKLYLSGATKPVYLSLGYLASVPLHLAGMKHYRASR
jgi:hypothetical protein